MRKVGYLVGIIVAALAADARADEREILEHVSAGERLWKRSCGVPGDDGICITLVPIGGGDRCAFEPLPLAVAVARNRKEARRAQRHFAEAIALWDRLDADERTLTLADTVTAAHMYVADQKLEAYLAVKFPTSLDFASDAKKSRQRLTEWMDTMNDRLGDALDDYREVARTGAAPWRVAAVARSGLIFRHYVEVLLTAEIPLDVRTGDYATEKIQAYCDALEDVAAPMGERAVDSFESCIDDAKQTGTADWQSRCEREHRRALLYAPGIST